MLVTFHMLSWSLCERRNTMSAPCMVWFLKHGMITEFRLLVLLFVPVTLWCCVCSAGCGIPPVLARIHMQALLCCPIYSVLHILNKAASFHLWKLSDRVALTRICDCIFSLGRVEWPSRLYRHYMWLRLHGTRTLLSVQLQIEDVHTVYIPTVAPRSIRFWRHHTEQPHPWHRS